MTDAAPSVLVTPVAPGITEIRLNRPSRLNALDFPTVAALHDALDAVAGDDDCKVAILTGEGRGFCSGLDLADWGDIPAVGAHPHRRAGVDAQAFIANLTVHMRDTPQIIIAAVNGVAFGGGLALACAADVRFAARSARFCSAFIRTGLTGTDIGISYLLPRLVGVSRAFDMIISGRAVDAEEADRMGLVSQVVGDDQLMEAVLAYAHGVAGYTKVGLRMTKEVLWHNIDSQDLAAAIAIENRNQTIAGATAEVRDYMAAYRKKTTGA